MNKILHFLSISIFTITACISYSYGQTIGNKLSVDVKITSISDSSISFQWSAFQIVATDIYKKSQQDSNWTLLVTLSSSTNVYTDGNFQDEIEYEYRFDVSTGSNPSVAFGYIAAGYNVAPKNSRGGILVLVDNRFSNDLESDLQTLKYDLLADGYSPYFMHVSKDSSVSFIKSQIINFRNSYDIKYIYILGHISVPYSGMVAPDGHGDHFGAWPADSYYASMSNIWTDTAVNYTNSVRPVNSNIPNDGKFDQNSIQEKLTAGIARVDFYNLPAHSKTELQLYKDYLSAVSAYKHGTLPVLNKAVIDDNFQTYWEGFSQNGFRNAWSLLGSDSTFEDDYLTRLNTGRYKWSYGCGGGTDSSVAGIGSINDLKNSNYKGVFSMLLGSYSGDWNTSNNFLRYLLAEGKMLTTCWAGRPNWFFHQMGLNNPIGYSAMQTMNNAFSDSLSTATSYYSFGQFNRGIYLALFGDPTLRNEMKEVITSSSITTDTTNGTALLNWQADTAYDIRTFQIYKFIDTSNAYSLLTELADTNFTFTDSNLLANTTYIVKAVYNEITNSGQYFNQDLGKYLEVGDVYNSSGSLPVELIRFTAKLVSDKTYLEWSTASEINVSHFEIQKSQDMKNWDPLGIVNANGTTSATSYYEIIDQHPFINSTYYRLKMVDFDGHIEFSPISSVKRKAGKISLYPNPNKDHVLFVNAPFGLDHKQIKVINNIGQEVPFILDKSSGSISLLADQSGIIFITIQNETHLILLL